MSADDLAAVIVILAAMIGLGILVVLAVSMQRTLKSMQRAVDDLVAETMPVVTDLRSTVTRAKGELERVDGLLGTAESIGGTVDSASRLAYLALSNPAIKVLAFASGTARVAAKLRRADRSDR